EYPYIAINSGRPQAFIEAIAQVCSIHNFSVFENGAGIFRYNYSDVMELYLDPKIDGKIKEKLLQLDQVIAGKFKIQCQPNKDYSLTYLFSLKKSMDENNHNNHNNNNSSFKKTNVADLDKVFIFIKKYLEEDSDEFRDFWVEKGKNFININIKGLSKGTGLQLVMKKMQLKPENIAGIGDSPGDWEFLKYCGFSACPSNAADDLKEKVDYVSPFSAERGILDIISYINKKKGLN
ncbi:MAG: HAD-IIB family hydrolase, partial [Promethearchaeota archaeon]